MMKIVFKYDLNLAETEIALPEGTVILHVDCQASEYGPALKLWALVPNNYEQLVTRKFFVMPTGIGFNAENTQFIGTIKPYMDGRLIFHVFERLG